MQHQFLLPYLMCVVVAFPIFLFSHSVCTLPMILYRINEALIFIRCENFRYGDDSKYLVPHVWEDLDA